MLRGYIPSPARRPIGPLNIHPTLAGAATSIWPLDDRYNGASDYKRQNILTFAAPAADPLWNGTRYGRALTGDGAKTAICTLANTITAYPAWVAGSFYIDSLSATKVAVSVSSATGSAQVTVGFTTTGSVIYTQIRVLNASTTIVINGPAAVVGKLYHFASLTRSQTDHRLWVNGDIFTGTTDLGAWTTAFVNAGLMCTGLAGAPLPGAVFWGAYGQVDPGDAFFRDLTLNPWKYLYAPQRRIYSVASSGIQFDAAANSGYQAASSTYTFNRTVTGSNTFLAVDVSLLSAGQTVTSIVDDNGGGNVAMTFIGAQSTVSSVGRVESWGLVNPTTGTKQIQVNLSGSIASAASAVSYTGVHQTSPYESFNGAQATNVGAADATVTITPVANNTWIHAAVATDDTAITANQTTRNNVTGAGGSGADEDTGPISPAAATAMSYSNVGALATWAIAGYAIRPVAAPSLLASGWGALVAGFRNMIVRA